jgi:stress-induced-phosphoprotein 1
LDKNDHKLFGNRSASYFKTGKYQLAFEDADRACQLYPTWSKGFYRKGQALQALKRYDEAYVAYTKGKSSWAILLMI